MRALHTVGLLLGMMAAVSLVEAAIPMRQLGPWGRLHRQPNLMLTAVTFATNLVFNTALVLGLVALRRHGLGLLNVLALPPVAAGIVAVVILDASFYACHVAMHALPGLWRFHAVHHCDPAVDVTTTIRQHPVEGAIRYAVMAVAAFLLGASPEAFGVYRVASAANGLLEHANLRAPRWLDRTLALITTWPHMHKIHHSRVPRQTNSNYGNLLSLWDRLFGTFTPSGAGTAVPYGLEGHDAAATQTTTGLLMLPFRAPSR
jgi:sterol desaturase/sphingolipid hydroxylase (fatty acid hydroxylase superfamily)